MTISTQLQKFKTISPIYHITNGLYFFLNDTAKAFPLTMLTLPESNGTAKESLISGDHNKLEQQ